MSLCIFTRRTHVSKNNKKNITKCTMTNDFETSRLNSYICPHFFTPLTSKGSIPQRRGPTVTSRQYGRRAMFVSGNIRFQDGVVVDLGKLGGPLSSFVFLFFFLSLELTYFAIRYTQRTNVVSWYSGLCDIRVLFVYVTCQCAWRIAPFKFNSVSF